MVGLQLINDLRLHRRINLRSGDHDVEAAETMPLLERLERESSAVSKMKVTTPESENYDYQTRINPTTQATAKVRWVPWVTLRYPPVYNQSTSAFILKV